MEPEPEPEPLPAELKAELAALAPGQSKVVRDGKSLQQYHCFGQPWEVVLAAYEMRFANLPHPELPLMVSAEVVHRDSAHEELGKEIFTRQVVVRNGGVPRVLSAMAGGDTMEFEEDSVYDRYLRRATKDGRNLSFREGSWGIKLDETMEYVVHRSNPGWTWFHLSATLALPRLPGGITGTAEKFFADLYIDGVGRGRKIDANFIEELLASGKAAELLPWTVQFPQRAARRAALERRPSPSPSDGSTTQYSSYEDAYEGPRRTFSPAPALGELGPLLTELREVRAALLDVTRRLDTIESRRASGDRDRERRSAEAAAGESVQVWRRCCWAAMIGSLAASFVSWRFGGSNKTGQ